MPGTKESFPGIHQREAKQRRKSGTRADHGKSRQKVFTSASSCRKTPPTQGDKGLEMRSEAELLRLPWLAFHGSRPGARMLDFYSCVPPTGESPVGAR